MTYHPQGGSSSSKWFHGDQWLDFNMLQSGHGAKDIANYKMIAADYERTPAKPTLDGEPRYEDHPVNWKPQDWFDDFDSRQAAYWALLAGACGHTYGCHDIWQMYDTDEKPIAYARTPWRKAMDLPGAWDMLHVRHLLLSRPFTRLVPDQSLLEKPGSGAGHVQAARDSEGSFALIYTPLGSTMTVDVRKLSGEQLRAWWFDARTGDS